LAAKQINKHVRRGAKGSDFAERNEPSAQCLPASFLRCTCAAPAARHRKAHFGARINHSGWVNAKTFRERQEFGFSRMTLHFKLALVYRPL
jgi:hypothetical protein